MKALSSGIILCIIIAAAAVALSHIVTIGGVAIAIILGIAVRNLFRLPGRLKPGIKFSEKTLLGYAIALMGFNLDYRIISSLGIETLVIILCGVPFTIAVTLLIGRAFGLHKDAALLLGVGNGICGSSAIAAAQGVIQTDEEHVGVTTAATNLFGTLGIFLLPALTLLIPGFLEQQQGILIGNTLQAIGQVSAGGYSLSETIGETAMVVKMGRILLITPVVLLLAAVKRSSSPRSQAERPRIPSYLLLFLLFSLISSLGFIPADFLQILSKASKYLLTIAMAGIGMSISKGVLKQGGTKALVTGSIAWILQIGFSILLILSLI